MSPYTFAEKLAKISSYLSRRAERHAIYITGGEPFLYKYKDRKRGYFRLMGLVKIIREVIPSAKLIIKTSGWKEHKVLDEQLESIMALSQQDKIEIRLGFNLYQNNGFNALERLSHMVTLLIKHQKETKVETIYDKSNLVDTVQIIKGALRSINSPDFDYLKAINSEPTYGRRFIVPCIHFDRMSTAHIAAYRLIRLDTMPAYPTVEEDISGKFYKAEIKQLCQIVKTGPNQILYNPDLSMHHCNDAFADHSIPGIPDSMFKSIEEAFDFFANGFVRLRHYLLSNRINFQQKREQCLFCTKFIRSRAGDRKDDSESITTDMVN
jgi:hypothetical protein